MVKTDVQCRFCKKTFQPFQLDYIYTAHKEGIKEQVVTMEMNGSGVRDISRVLNIGLNTVLRTLKNSNQSK